MKRLEKNGKNDLLKPDFEPETSFAEIDDGVPQQKKPELRLELKLKQRNRKEIRK